ncbi:MAG: hypothetical protein ALAOOOJD_04441 [bacterium]|nr:hypothetical protein [bacterium]
MRSSRGFFAALFFLLGIPLAVLCQKFLGIGVETTFHLTLAAGFALMACAVFDFKITRWITWIGCVSASALAVIFLLQGVSALIQNESLTYLAYQVLGQRLEKWLGDLLIFWLVAMLLIDSQGKTRILGLLAMSIVVCLEVYSYSSSYLGASLNATAADLKILYLLPFVWVLFESKKKISLAIAPAYEK